MTSMIVLLKEQSLIKKEKIRWFWNRHRKQQWGFYPYQYCKKKENRGNNKKKGRKSKNVNIRISNYNLELVKKEAKEEGLP